MPGWVKNRGFWLGAIIVIGLALRLPGLDPNLTDHNTWRQADTATIARNFLEDPRILWPRVNWGAPGPGYVEAEFQLLPFVASLTYRVLGENPIYGRLFSILATGLSCWFLDRIARRFFSHRLALVCVAMFLMAPVVFRYSRVFMPDAIALLFMIIALERFLAFLDNDHWTTLTESAVSMSLAILVKPTTIHIGVVLVVLAVARLGWRSLLGPKLFAFAAISLLPPASYYAHAASIYLDYGNTFGVIIGGDSKWGTLAWRLDPHFYWNLAFIEAAWILGPVGTLLAIVGLLRFRPTIWRLLVVSWALATAAYYFIVARYAGNPDLGLHYHLFAAPLMALLATGGLAVVAEVRGIRRWMLGALAVGVFGYQGICDGWILAMREGPRFIEAGRAVARVSDPGDLILVLSQDVAMDKGVPNNFEQANVFFHARRRGRVLAWDRQSRAGFEAAITPEFKWFVNFPSLNGAADASFHAFIAERMTRVAVGEDFEVYRIEQAPSTTEGIDQ
jgi:4-amino-4-deoxy-L-arabinose transferase-like glycosyltransferase